MLTKLRYKLIQLLIGETPVCCNMTIINGNLNCDNGAIVCDNLFIERT